ncbi:MAG: RNA methyltransferase [Clostridiales bacterium]|nr:RNA methyltransferase [Clostridiales bacterium]
MGAIKEITSTANAQVKRWRQLRFAAGRRAHGLFLAEGEHLCEEALKVSAAISYLVQKDQADTYARFLHAGCDAFLVSPQVIKALSDSKTPQGCVAVCHLPAQRPLESAGSRLLALNRLQDPGNLGTIWRTLDAAGFDGLLIDPGCADPFSPKALRASMGAVFRVPVYACDDLADTLRVLPHTKVAGDLSGTPYYEHPPFGDMVCLLVGNEGAGLDEALLQLSDYRLRLPIPGGAESLNAAVAAGLMIYDILGHVAT